MKPLKGRKGILLEEPDYFGERCFCEAAIHTFPELVDLRENRLHIQMLALANAARTAIAAGDRLFLSRIFAFLEQILTTVRLHPEVENAVTISFLVQDDFNGADWAKELLPKNLRCIVWSN